MRIQGNRNGSALLLSLWALLTLSVAVFALAKYVDQGIGTVREANLGLDAKALAHSGLVVALNPLATPQTPALVADFGQGRGYRVRMVGEGGKLDLNALLGVAPPGAGPIQPRDPRLVLLKDYLHYRGLKSNDIQTLVDCMLDWVEPGDLHHMSGVKDDGDYHAARHPFRSLDEVAKVKGSGPLVSLPHWQDDFTLYNPGGAIDLQWASVAVLSNLPGVGEVNARGLVQYRQGKDKLDGTMDDNPLTQALALSLLGFSNSNPSPFNLVVGNNTGVFRIISIGTSGKVSRQVEAVVQSRQGNQSIILLWKEN